MCEEPNHMRKKNICVHVAKDIRKSLKLARSVVIRKGDSVKVLRGDHKGKSGAILEVNPKEGVVYIEGITRTNSRTKKEVPIAIQPSNIILVSRGDIKAISKKAKEKKTETKKETKEEKKEEAKEKKNEEKEAEKPKKAEEKAKATA
ncbi:MAG: 50S ribosomal protein L24 [Candidatus Micrarchaeota archaeon]|nr:50S ribosomal protein L24 [Candidatus Micrarchaeota archaeon]